MQNRAFQDILSPVALSWPLLGHFGWAWGVHGVSFGRLWGSLGVPLGRFWASGGIVWGSFGLPLSLFGSLLGYLGVPLGPQGHLGGAHGEPRPHFRSILE